MKYWRDAQFSKELIQIHSDRFACIYFTFLFLKFKIKFAIMPHILIVTQSIIRNVNRLYNEGRKNVGEKVDL